MRTRRSVVKEPPPSPATKRARRAVISSLADMVLEKQVLSTTGRRRQDYGYMKELVKMKQRIYPWLTRDMLYSKINRHKKKLNKEALDETQDRSRTPLFSTDGTPDRPRAGRPKGCTDQSIVKKKNTRIAAINELCERVKKERESGGVPRNRYNRSHEEVMEEFGLQDEAPIKYDLVRKRLIRGCTGKNKKSPVEEIEPVLLAFASQRQEAGQPLKPSEGLELANALIHDTPIQEKLLGFQSAHYGQASGVLSKGFWRGFMRRHQHILSQVKGSRLAANRQEWTTYENLEVMYDLVYDQMVVAGVARQLRPEEEYWVDCDGERVERESQAAGLKVRHEITHPEWILFGDEVGTNLDQTEDGHIGGQTYLAVNKTSASLTSSMTNSRFTVIGFTAASGDPVMCLVVFAAEELTFQQRLGYDMRSSIPYNTQAPTEDNCGPNKAFPGAPVCKFRGKEVPALISMSPKGSITLDILRAAFERFDSLGLYPRQPGGPTPFALFDAHDSRLQLPFLNYINEKMEDGRPKWKVCIGLPNGTSLWQVGDSAQQNGCWKMAMYCEKDMLLRYKQRMGMPPKLTREDIIPLVNRAWAASFSRKQKNIVAIRDRGWNPLDWRLLKLPCVVRTRHEEDKRTVANENVNNEPLLPTPPSEIEVQVGSTVDELSTITASSISDLNFNNGISKEFSVDFLQYLVRKKEVRVNLDIRYQQGKEARGKLDVAKKLTGGNMFKSGKIVLDEEVVSMRQRRQKASQIRKTNSQCNIRVQKTSNGVPSN